MLKSQEILLRQSELRQRLNTIAGMEGDTLTDEIRAESVKLRKELDGKETEFRKRHRDGRCGHPAPGRP